MKELLLGFLRWLLNLFNSKQAERQVLNVEIDKNLERQAELAEEVEQLLREYHQGNASDLTPSQYKHCLELKQRLEASTKKLSEGKRLLDTSAERTASIISNAIETNTSVFLAQHLSSAVDNNAEYQFPGK